MRDMFLDVLDFHQKFCPDRIGNWAGDPPPESRALRAELIAEESGELYGAMRKGDVEGVADAIADLIYVTLGTAVDYGIDIRPVWEAVHKANMAKEGGGTREDGKILKPEGWEPPDVQGCLDVQGSIKELLVQTDYLGRKWRRHTIGDPLTDRMIKTNKGVPV